VLAEGGEEGREGRAVGLVRGRGYLRGVVSYGDDLLGLGRRTGVRSLLSSSVADAAASMRSSHRLPKIAAWVCGSADMALRS
jgi:hypothetical protein